MPAKAGEKRGKKKDNHFTILIAGGGLGARPTTWVGGGKGKTR